MNSSRDRQKSRPPETVVAEGPRLLRYRYRTPALTGQWRDSRDAALRDAINAKQALDDENEPGGVRWLVPGEIEEDESGTSLKQRIRRH
jgi:hypothetical protein